MGLPTDTWGELIVHIIETKLDTVTLRAWEQDEKSREFSLDGFTDFLQQRCQILERIEARSKTNDSSRKVDNDKAQSKNRNHGKNSSNEKVAALTVTEEGGRCHLCRGNHYIYQCDKFTSLAIEDRIKEVQRLKLCMNCLRNDHFVKSCKMGSCRVCSKRHNTLCHRPAINEESSKASQGTEGEGKDSSSKASNVVVHHASGGPQRRHGYGDGRRRTGSEVNFITKAACNKLGVKLDRAQETVTGINERESKVFQSCHISLQSRHSKFRIDTIHCLVVPTITKRLPSIELDVHALQIPLNIKLADIEFYKPSTIDVLLGAEYFFDVMQTEKIELGENQPSLRNTKFGWVIAGKLLLENSTSISCNHESVVALTCSLEQNETLDESLKRFWEIENVESKTQALSVNEKQCEQIFKETVTRDTSGRFIVKLPFKSDPSKLGVSRSATLKRLVQLERRFNNNELLRERYTQFMREYTDLGHMSLVSDTTEDEMRKPLYLPHHGVIKESSTSTKLRVVFDASNKTSTGLSLNDVLHVGPTLQANLIEIIMRFRCYNVALTADLKKMYRQVLVHPDDRDYQRILWRFSPADGISEFRLNTVTYGQSSSSYLAVKCMRILAEQASEKYREAARVILDEMYVDDILTGADDIVGAIEVQGQLTELLQAGGFKIHKWCTSHPESLNHVASEDREELSKRAIDANETIRTLGLEWDPNSDLFQFAVGKAEAAKTKRQILSAISKIFDPLGLIGPILTAAKVLMQETWKLEYNWDDTLPFAFVEEWEKLRQNLDAVSRISIPRRVISSERPVRLYLQGFCDASERAYGACVYVQVEHAEGALSSRLFCSKSRVAPIKTMSIPRLELSSALLLSRLIINAKNSLNRQVNEIQVWTDSKVALCWIQGDPARWKPFVANRSELWWTGPRWLQEKRPAIHLDSSKEPAEEILETVAVERRSEKHAYKACVQEEQVAQELLNKFSSLTKVERVMAYCGRFSSNARKNITERNFDRLSAVELQEAQLKLIQGEQAIHFTEEISALSKNQTLSSSSNLIRWHPFLDKRGLLRVGGRLQNSGLSFEQRHPIILPAKSTFSRLLFEREHRRLLHASQLLLLSTIREKYWPINGRSIARQVCHACIWCSRHKPRETIQIMGALPNERVKPSWPFTFTGVDFAGPITTLVNKGRGRKTNKSYVALFVCFATKAIHLEATSELSTAAFLATFRRFIGRRGKPHIMYSDNGTNFVGAHREIREIYQFLQKEMDGELGDTLANECIDWKFLPPGSPHMGGLWEAGVKSCKYHLKRYMGQALLTFEELTTVLVQIEACLNSRPISALSNDPCDLQPLTPAHFLVGESLVGLPDLDATEIPLNRLQRWQLTQRITQDIWRRWSTEYISTLQGRSKWNTNKPNLQLGDLVVIKDENLPPIRWKMDRIVELHPGSDKHVRVVTVRASNGRIKRSIAKVCKLPVSTTIKKEESSKN
ncbi:uncharacterized protein [Venturia canescens]|uniref:uncharacterized protein n=1 Tax=Venturia canescens TaxID=32260 RepID=UPI001C9BC056|nr:uncharacterized protein LOC122408495 [Venturia canescens]